ncbi:MAG: hypothetical protein LC754_16505 [Acidobacteria bacterium]|nr:hypothetical protein [Acidobacteriota bacterium]
MPANIDPRLMAQLEEAGDDKDVEALLVVAHDTGASDSTDKRGSAEKLVDRVVKKVKKKPTKVRYMPKLGVAYVKGKGDLIRQLLQQDEVTSASANDADVMAPHDTDQD